MVDTNTNKAKTMKFFVAIFLLFLCSCKDPTLTESEIEGVYSYKNVDTYMVLKIAKGGDFSWSISEKDKVIRSQVGKWETYDLDGENPRLLIKGFCFPPGVSRANHCTNEYPAIIERDYLNGRVSLPLDIDRSGAALKKMRSE